MLFYFWNQGRELVLGEAVFVIPENPQDILVLDFNFIQLNVHNSTDVQLDFLIVINQRRVLLYMTLIVLVKRLYKLRVQNCQPWISKVLLLDTIQHLEVNIEWEFPQHHIDKEFGEVRLLLVVEQTLHNSSQFLLPHWGGLGEVLCRNAIVQLHVKRDIKLVLADTPLDKHRQLLGQRYQLLQPLLLVPSEWLNFLDQYIGGDLGIPYVAVAHKEPFLDSEGVLDWVEFFVQIQILGFRIRLSLFLGALGKDLSQ